MKSRVLVVDDEKNITLVIQAMLEREGLEPYVFNDPSEALRRLPEIDPDVVITDLHMPGLSGMELLEHVQTHHRDLPVVVITAFGTVEAAVSALKKGAFDFITKPFDQTELLHAVQKAVATGLARQKDLNSRESFSILGTTPQVQEIYKVVTKVAPSPTTVLITGESGTGKELVAFEIHRRSLRVDKPFIKINCAAIPANLIESELFGHERGAFTGAVSSKPGRFELAHEGTLFMDEVADMPLEMQVKLLRVLQEQEFERVGGISPIRVDVRLIAATNKNLETEVREGRFREDLFYRLNVVPITLPPLRERSEDIDEFVVFFLKQFQEKLGKSISGIEPEALNILRRYSWPGNIRQLENVIERMVLMSDGPQLCVSDLPDTLRAVAPSTESSTEDGDSFKSIVRRQTQTLERDLIEKALEETAGNVTKAAEKLGLSRKGLQLKMKDLGLERPGHQKPGSGQSV